MNEINVLSTMKLSTLFMKHSDKYFLFIRPGGNWGDQLIYWGAEFLADSLGIKWVSVHVDNFDVSNVDNNTIIYIHGGGGYNPWCSGSVARALILATSSSAKTIIQGPQTFDNTNNYVADFFSSIPAKNRRNKKIIIFAREKVSFFLLDSIISKQYILNYDMDTALHLSKDEFIRRANIRSKKYNLIALREDDESPNCANRNGSGVRMDPALYASSFEHWLRIHAAAKSIVTNRTHSSIAGAILEIPTTLLGGSYHKNHSIWEAFLADKGVLWGDYDDEANVSWKSFNKYVPNCIAKSWKVKEIIYYIHGIPSS